MASTFYYASPDNTQLLEVTESGQHIVSTLQKPGSQVGVLTFAEFRQYRESLIRQTDPSTQPNYQRFLDLILVSNLYQSIVAQSTTNSAVNTGLTVTMGALILASNGRPNVDGLQAGINLLFSALTYTRADIDELTNILAQTNLTNLVTIPQP